MALAPITRMFVYLPPSQVGDPSPLLADNISPSTRDFADLFVGMDPTDAAVQVAVSTTRGSGASVREDGIRLTGRKMLSNAEATMEADVKQALGRLTRQRDIKIVGVTFGGPDIAGNATGSFDPSTQTAQLNLQYQNLRSLDPRVRTTPLPAGRRI
jgi:hypothetical protein